MTMKPQSDDGVLSQDERIHLLESVSALADGQLSASELDHAIAFSSGNDMGRNAWNRYENRMESDEGNKSRGWYSLRVVRRVSNPTENCSGSIQRTGQVLAQRRCAGEGVERP